jgi:hypothetical protein
MQGEAMSLRAALVGLLTDAAPLEFDELDIRLPGCTWNQLFSMVDQMSRTGILSVSRRTRASFVVRHRGHPMRADLVEIGNQLQQLAYERQDDAHSQGLECRRERA